MRHACPSATAGAAAKIGALALVLLSCTTSDAESPAAARSAELPEGAQARSLLGDPLFPPRLPDEVRLEREENLERALAELEARPDDPDALVWVGRRLAYLGDYIGAIERFSEGTELHPRDARFFRHRGHRHLTVRDFDRAIADFERAVELRRGLDDEVEPDGLPNALGVPTSTLHFNIWYHLGLAHYVKGDFESALEAYRACLEVSDHPDSIVATSHWLYMTLRRLGRDEEAAAVLEGIDEDMEIIESDAYLGLLLMYRGERTPDEVVPEGSESLQNVTAAYGVGNWHLYNGRADEALAVFRRIMTEADQWAAFGYIAAEAELARHEGS